MSGFVWRSAPTVAAAALLIAFAWASGAQAESMRSQCSEKYKAAQKANQLGGQSWSQFYKSCKAELKAEKAEKKEEKAEKKTKKTEPAPTPAATPAPMPTPAPEKKAAAPAPGVTGPIIYPKAIDPKYANLSAGRARMKTCVDQYNANKATNSNGGLKWIEKGGGYYSLCNKALGGGKK